MNIYGITGLSVSLFGAEGIPDSPNHIPVDMFLPAVQYLRIKKSIAHISIYGQSMGSIFAVLAAQYIGGFENLIMVSPTHVPFEGTLKDKKTMTGRSIATWKGCDIPYVTADFSKVKAGKYQKHPDAKCRVTGMWVAYHDAYNDSAKVSEAKLSVEKTGARVLLIAGDEDEYRQFLPLLGTLPENAVAVRSIVSSSMADEIAANYGVEMRVVLTGFKYIGEQILLLEQAGEQDRFVFGFEESCGYLGGSFVRDKDGVYASMILCELTSY